MSQSGQPASTLSASGIGLAIGCYSLWGLVPIYWKGIIEIPAAEALIPRILWTLVLLSVAVRLSGRAAETWTKGGREWGWTLLAALLLAGNWGLFVYAVQTDQVLKNLSAVLEAAGGSLSSIVKTTVFLEDMGDFGGMNEVYARFFGDHRPARAAVAVRTLPKNVGVEIEAIAKIS